MTCTVALKSQHPRVVKLFEIPIFIQFDPGVFFIWREQWLSHLNQYNGKTRALLIGS
jgi:hypothetical protein